MCVSVLTVCKSVCVMFACDTDYESSLRYQLNMSKKNLDLRPNPIRLETTPQSGQSGTHYRLSQDGAGLPTCEHANGNAD